MPILPVLGDGGAGWLTAFRCFSQSPITNFKKPITKPETKDCRILCFTVAGH
jgi:hypothetical protein